MSSSDINECHSSPCQNNGTCVDHVNGFTCTCGRNFTGKFCEKRTYLKIQNLHFLQYSFVCFIIALRLQGYWEQYNNDTNTHFSGNLPCSSSPCMNSGVCVNKLPNSFWCRCRYGYGGDQCEIGIHIHRHRLCYIYNNKLYSQQYIGRNLLYIHRHRLTAALAKTCYIFLFSSSQS